jgi:hypothetical protein
MKTRIGALVGFFVMLTAPVHAATFTFDFNSLADGAANGTVDTYMKGVLPGTSIAGSVASKTYTGDDHVVGPTDATGVFHPVTLGTTDHALGTTIDPSSVPRAGAQTSQGGGAGTNDTFIMTKSGTNLIGGNDALTITFSSAVTLVSFDWEIFPDGSCPSPSNCGAGGANRPDLKLFVNGSAVSTFTASGINPGTAGTFTRSFSMAAETAPQAIGTYTPGGGIPGVTRLDFVDWPAAIAIDNLKVNTPPPPPTRVPQPSAMMMLALGGALLGWKLRRA